MVKTTITGIKDGLIHAEVKKTPVLITELIANLHNMTEAEVYKALCEIRESAEQDAMIMQIFAKALRKKNSHNRKSKWS